ncbi:MAG: GreA/GreB family elongation factor [Luteolibacter sp.]
MNAVTDKLVLKKKGLRSFDQNMYMQEIHPLSADHKNAEQLYEELKTAEVHTDEKAMPADVIRVNSLVEVEELRTGRKLTFRIVLPAEADNGKQQLSVFAPLSIALMGYRKDMQVSWDMPSGQKIFLIRKVINGG